MLHPPRPQLPRRAVLLASGMGALALVTTTSCGSQEAEPEPVEVQPTEPEAPDENLLDESALIGAYLGVIEAFPELRGSLTSIADQHRAHARELGATTDQLATIAPIPPAAKRVKAALTELIARERAAARLRAETANSSDQADAIRALTYIAASESSHVPELRDLRANA